MTRCTTALVSAGISILLALPACETGEGAVSWQEFQEMFRRDGVSGPIYVIEWDQVVSEDELAVYYRRYLDGTWDDPHLPAIVRQVGDADDVWTDEEKGDLTYCVSDDFGDDKDRAVNEMAGATAAWEAVANVDFVYAPEQDGECNGDNDAIRIPVRPHGGGGAYTYTPENLRTNLRVLAMNFADFDDNEVYEELSPNVTTEGVFRHELGHTLGLLHEHVRVEEPSIGCTGPGNYREVTEYDQSSVMHYPWCDGVLESDLSITDQDAAAVRELYGEP